MTASQGANIDQQNHSMFKPAYPTIYYAAQFHLDKDTPLEMAGALKAGTRIDLYLSKINGSGNLSIIADGINLYSEDLYTSTYKTEAPLSRYYPYAKSDKLVSITLLSDVDTLQISYSGRWFEWSGIDVTLPASYSVKRWWFPSAYDANTSGTENTGPTQKDTSTIMISPNSYDKGRQLTIHEDITYSSPDIFAQSNLQTIEDWAKTLSAYSPHLVVRFENAQFSSGVTHDSAIQYYSDALSTFNKYGMSWYSNDYYSLTHAHWSNYAGIKPVSYKGQEMDIEMIELLQKYQ
jgi:hypothetical protein